MVDWPSALLISKLADSGDKLRIIRQPGTVSNSIAALEQLTA